MKQKPHFDETSIYFLLLIVAKSVLAYAIFYLGFRQISDDDYARLVISQGFVEEPKLDPSGTSWLPFPFWWQGLWLICTKPNIEHARFFGALSSAMASGLCLLGLVHNHVKPKLAFFSMVLVASLPWNIWLSASWVPEGFTGDLYLACLFFRRSKKKPLRLLSGLGLIMVAWSRYDYWGGLLGLFFYELGKKYLFLKRRKITENMPATSSRRGLLDLLVSLFFLSMGPLCWMGWNRYAHGDGFHFIKRVTRYYRSAGQLDKTLQLQIYPKALANILGLPFLVWFCLSATWIIFFVALRRSHFFSRWMKTRNLEQKNDPRSFDLLWTILDSVWAEAAFSVTGIFLFVVYGQLKGGAPTHHPERAVLSIASFLCIVFLCVFFTYLERCFVQRQKNLFLALVLICFSSIGVDFFHRSLNFPGRSSDEDREAQIQEGRANRLNPAPILRPCRYEHFAWIAGYEKPSRVHIEPKPDPQNQNREGATETKNDESYRGDRAYERSRASSPKKCPELLRL